MQLPERINASWADALADTELLQAESQLHDVFNRIETDERRSRGDEYELATGSAALMLAWQQWNIVNLATRARGLHPRYRPPTSRRKG